MVFMVRMLAFADGAIREVDVPSHELAEGTTKEHKLELVFRYGQNEFQPRPLPSVSMGDVVEMDGTLNLCCATGFLEISEPEYKVIAAMGRVERQVWLIRDMR